MRLSKHLYLGIVLILLVILSSAIILDIWYLNNSSHNGNAVSPLDYEWTQPQGNSGFTRYSAGLAPNSSDLMWKTNITGVQSFLSAFNGKIFVTTKTQVFALDKDTGDFIWNTTVPAPGPWPMVYKIDSGHMIVEGTCLDPQNGDILWTSDTFGTDTGLYNNNVYSPEEKMFYVKNLSFLEAWNFTAPSVPPTLEWETYVPGGGRVGSGLA